MATTRGREDRAMGATVVSRAVEGLSATPRPPAMGRRERELLGGVPLFAGLTPSHLRHVAKLAEVVRFGEGRPIVRRGAKGSSFYVLAEGTANVQKGPSGRTVAALGPGAFFGELAFLDGHPRSASVVATSPVTAIRIERPAFIALIRKEPVIGLRVMEGLTQRIRLLERTTVD
jgi:CRP/FNR family cyclic AMP-dependent transcriptional regulator